MKKELVLVGYSGHAFVALEIASQMGLTTAGYCDLEKKAKNPYNLDYLGSEKNPETIQLLENYEYFVSVGDNRLRRKISEVLIKKCGTPVNLIHPYASVSPSAESGSGIMVAAGSCVNPQSIIGNGVICNTCTIIEHECKVGNFAHLAPGAVLCGDVEIGEMTFIGANSVIKEGVRIGTNVFVGAGSVVIKDLEDGVKVAGNPQRKI